jgi:hypothetical protein
MSTNHSPIYFHSSSARYPDSVSLEKEEQITKLIGPEYLIPKKEDLDQAFEIAKTIKNSTVQHFALSDICKAYLKLSTDEGCEKGYEVAQYKEKQVADIRELLNQIIGVCIRLKTPASISLGKKIFVTYPKQMALAEHKNAFYVSLDDLGDNTPQPRKTTVSANELNRKVEDLLIARGDLNVILGREAKELAEKRQLQRSIEVANNIQNEIERDGIIACIFEKCCSYGDPESLSFALEIAKNKKHEYRDSYIYSLIETCKKQGNKPFALQSVEEMQNQQLKEKTIHKIHLWKV